MPIKKHGINQYASIGFFFRRIDEDGGLYGYFRSGMKTTCCEEHNWGGNRDRVTYCQLNFMEK
jgi:hypothetical protein